MITIRIENISVAGFQEAFRGLRNPLNSWDRADSHTEQNKESFPTFSFDDNLIETDFVLGDKDKALALKMNTSSEQSKYRRMIICYFDIVAPLYFYKEMDTYKVGTVCNSCSTMHTIHKRPLTIDDFSHDNLTALSTIVLNKTIQTINTAREEFLESGREDKEQWYQMIQLLPSSFNQRRTYMMSYEVLASIYQQRKNHKLNEWHYFCDFIEHLPYSSLILPLRKEK